jgi:hypothetical protein
MKRICRSLKILEESTGTLHSEIHFKFRGTYSSIYIYVPLDLKETVCEVVDWIRVVQDMIQWQPIANTVMMFWVTERWEFLD